MPEFVVLLALAGVFDGAIDCDRCADWNRAQEPFRVYGNTWYVGTSGLSAVLIDSGDGLLLLDGGLPQSAPVIAGNIRALGFDPADIRFIGLSHAHFDHAGGIAALQRLSGADVYAGRDAAKALRAGQLRRDDPQFGAGMDGQQFPEVTDAVGVDDGWHYELGETRITAVATPGHTRGGMSWTWRSCEAARCLDIVYADSLTPVSRPGYRFSDGLGDRLRASLHRIGGLDCDILLSTHAATFALHDKLAAGREAFVDARACEDLAREAGATLDRRLNAEHL